MFGWLIHTATFHIHWPCAVFFLPFNLSSHSFFFFLKDPAPPEIYPLPLPAPLPICRHITASHSTDPLPRSGLTPNRASIQSRQNSVTNASEPVSDPRTDSTQNLKRRYCFMSPSRDRKSTRLNSSHLVISYAVFCLKK